ncbi:hypothetical protein [Escherichia coli]|uniref:hypothetical protein n=1 Tax=Escherichia coli TaxID=562 RepID=UPI003D9CA11B
MGVLYGAAKIRRIPSGEPDVSVLAGRGHRSPRGDVTSKARFSFQEARSAWGTATG